MSAARVLITGSTGLLGATFGAVLEEHGYSVTRHGRSSGDLLGDLAEQQVAAQLIARAEPDYIVNLAGNTDVDRCETYPWEAYRGNVRTVENLVAAIANAGRPIHLVQVSTDQLYDGQGPHKESAVSPANYYAFSKYAGELLAARTPSTILRTNFFGPSRKQGRASFSDWIVRALSNGDRVRVFEDVAFSPLSIERLSTLMCAVLERRITGVFNLGAASGMSKADFCVAVATMLGLRTDTMIRARCAEAGLKAYRPKDMRMDCGRFEVAFGVKLPTLEQEIESMRRSYDVRR